MYKTFKSFLNENLLKGKSEEDVKQSLSTSSYDDAFESLRDISIDGVSDPLQYLNNLKALSIEEESAFVIEIVEDDWIGRPNLVKYGMCYISADEIIDTIYKTIRSYYRNYFDNKEEYKEEHDKMIHFVERIDENTLIELNDLVYTDEIPINIYYKIGSDVHTLNDDDKILKYAK